MNFRLGIQTDQKDTLTQISEKVNRNWQKILKTKSFKNPNSHQIMLIAKVLLNKIHFQRDFLNFRLCLEFSKSLKLGKKFNLHWMQIKIDGMSKMKFKYWTDPNHFPHIKEAWGSFIIRRSFDEKKNLSKKAQKRTDDSSLPFFFSCSLTRWHFFCLPTFRLSTQWQKSNISEND